MVIKFVDERDAKGEVFATYHDIKDTLGVQLVPDMFRLLGAYPKLLKNVWPMLKSFVETREFEERAGELRESTMLLADAFDRRELDEKIKRGVAKEDLEPIDDALNVLYYVDPKLCMISLPIERAFGKAGVRFYESTPMVMKTPLYSLGWKQKVRETELKRADEAHAKGRLKEIYDDIKKTEGLKFVSSDYEVLGNWPGYLAAAWTSLKSWVNNERYISTVAQVREATVQLTSDYEIPIDEEKLRSWKMSSDDISDVRYALLQFAEYYPGITTNMSILWKSMQEIRGKQPVL